MWDSCIFTLLHLFFVQIGKNAFYLRCTAKQNWQVADTELLSFFILVSCLFFCPFLSCDILNIYTLDFFPSSSLFWFAVCVPHYRLKLFAMRLNHINQLNFFTNCHLANWNYVFKSRWVRTWNSLCRYSSFWCLVASTCHWVSDMPYQVLTAVAFRRGKSCSCQTNI